MIEDIGAMSQTAKTEIPNWRLGLQLHPNDATTT